LIVFLFIFIIVNSLLLKEAFKKWGKTFEKGYKEYVYYISKLRILIISGISGLIIIYILTRYFGRSNDHSFEADLFFMLKYFFIYEIIFFIVESLIQIVFIRSTKNLGEKIARMKGKFFFFGKLLQGMNKIKVFIKRIRKPKPYVYNIEDAVYITYKKLPNLLKYSLNKSDIDLILQLEETYMQKNWEDQKSCNDTYINKNQLKNSFSPPEIADFIKLEAQKKGRRFKISTIKEVLKAEETYLKTIKIL
jgi:hypothetical protein